MRHFKEPMFVAATSAFICEKVQFLPVYVIYYSIFKDFIRSIRIHLCCGKHTVAMNVFQTREETFGIVIAYVLCLAKHI